MTKDAPKIKSLVPYFGGKRMMAARIIEELGPHKAYWEPFCGSMAVLLCKKPSYMETVNDLHGDLINLARVIQDPAEGSAMYRRLRRLLFHDQLRVEATTELEKPFVPGPDRAFWYLVQSWVGRNGFAGTRHAYTTTFSVRYTASGGNPAVRLTSVVESIPAWRRRMRRVTILSRDAFEIIPKIDDQTNTAIYVDPPYIAKSTQYTHDFEPKDHQRLAGLLGAFSKARIVVSYYADAKLAEWYPAWTQRVIDVTKGLSHAGRRGVNKSRAKEVLLINGPSYAKDDGPDAPLFQGAPE